MNNYLFKSICLALLCLGIAMQATAQGIIVKKTDGTQVAYKASEVQSIETYGYGEEPNPEPQPGEHEWVDLGLPSGTLWATMNVGAVKPEDDGYYFAWGETEPKSDYSEITYKYFQDDNYTKYNTESLWGMVDNKTELDPEDDAATANWGEGWQMPTIAQLSELVNNRNTERVKATLNNIPGVRIISKSNGNEIFLPLSGRKEGLTLKYVDDFGDYWSRSLQIDFPFMGQYMRLTPYANMLSYESRYYGLTIRPVRVQEKRKSSK